jgi:hypothetical protein
MLLYELTSPAEYKYGGTLTQEETSRCLRQTNLSSPRWTPYPKRPCQVENICGKFVVPVGGTTATGSGRGTRAAGISSAYGGEGYDSDCKGEVLEECKKSTYVSCLSGQHLDRRLHSVSFRNDSPFGRQSELFHAAGHVTVRCTPGLPRSVIFKGVKGVVGARELQEDLFLSQAGVLPLVHMGVVSSCLGLRLQTSQCCYLENRVNAQQGSMQGGWMRVEPRSMDQCNIVRLAVMRWPGTLPEHLVPVSNDIVVTGKGSVMHRMAWSGVHWTTENERSVLSVCDWVSEAIAAVC